MARTVRIPRNVDVDEHVSIVVLPKASVPIPTAPTATVLNAATDVTYEHTNDGAQPTSSQTTVNDPRFSLKEVPQAGGSVTHTFNATWFYGDDELELDGILQEGAEVLYYFRDAIPIEDDFAAPQELIGYALKVGHPQENRATNGKLTKTAPMFISRKFKATVTA